MYLSVPAYIPSFPTRCRELWRYFRCLLKWLFLGDKRNYFLVLLYISNMWCRLLIYILQLNEQLRLHYSGDSCIKKKSIFLTCKRYVITSTYINVSMYLIGSNKCISDKLLIWRRNLLSTILVKREIYRYKSFFLLNKIFGNIFQHGLHLIISEVNFVQIIQWTVCAAYY